MKKFYLVLAAVTGMTLASCTQNEYVGEVATQKAGSEAIGFGGGFKAVTRDTYGADAASSLGNKFIVAGVKGDGTGTGQQDVFMSYSVEWEANTAGTTESNTADWEYVGKTNNFNTSLAQAIKYWDFSATAYDFCAYSVGTGTTTATGTAISYADAATGAYTLTGSLDELAQCYITDMKTVPQANFKNEVELQFRSLASKARIAIYETVPGYSVQDVKFHSTDVTRPITAATSTKATLFGNADAFNKIGTYTVTFPKIGIGNKDDSDYNKAHVAFTPDATATGATSGVQEFGDLTGTLGTTSQAPTFANGGTYTTVLPNEKGVLLELCVDYTLVSTDGSGETIKVYGAKAFVPAAYTKWLSNYAYTYIFKISDNTNGWTNPKDDPDTPEGLFPITFDAVVLDSEETGHQTTITTVATPSITTYQKDHVYSASDEYVEGDIYVMAQTEGTPVTDFNKTTTNTFLYTLDATAATAPATEALVMDALNIRVSEETDAAGVTTITGRNGLVLTSADFDATIEAIPGEDGNDIAVAKNSAVKFTAAAGTYAFVYLVSAGTTTSPVITAVTLTTEPSDFATAYYTDAACTKLATTFTAGTTYYFKYTNLNNVYGVKVIKVE